MATPLLSELSIGEGATIALLPTEDPDQVLAELDVFWDELDRRPDLGDEPSDEEWAEVMGEWPPEDEPLSDPNYVRWVAEGSPAGAWNWAGDWTADVVAAEYRDDHVGM